jgi:nuclear GTP-binding protein
VRYLREEAPTVAFKCSTQKQAANLGRRGGRALPLANTADGGLSGAACLGAEALLQLLKNYARASDRKTAITVGARACALCGVHGPLSSRGHCGSFYSAVPWEARLLLICTSYSGPSKYN